LGWPVYWEAKSRTVYVNNRHFSDARLKRLPDGTLLVAVRDLQQVGGDVRWDADTGRAILADKDTQIQLRKAAKRVVIDRTKQELRAYQGKRMVLKSRISTGRQGKKTPAGTFRAGPYKARMHYSSLYDNAPMPWSVQVVGDIFVHGYQSVPGRPASHGCIRLPLDEGNPAKWFYHWVSIGTPVEITGRWRG
jgi:lipoprotein-anchoring transpeptidase ErfK/SrfK